MFEVWYQPSKGRYVKISEHTNIYKATHEVLRMKPGLYSIWDEAGSCHVKMKVGSSVSDAITPPLRRHRLAVFGNAA